MPYHLISNNNNTNVSTSWWSPLSYSLSIMQTPAKLCKVVHIFHILFEFFLFFFFFSKEETKKFILKQILKNFVQQTTNVSANCYDRDGKVYIYMK